MSNPPKRINKREIKELLGVFSDSTIARYIEDGLIPAPMKAGKDPRRARCFWWEHEVLRFLEIAAAETAKLDEATTARRAESQERRRKFYAALG